MSLHTLYPGALVVGIVVGTLASDSPVDTSMPGPLLSMDLIACSLSSRGGVGLLWLATIHNPMSRILRDDIRFLPIEL